MTLTVVTLLALIVPSASSAESLAERILARYAPPGPTTRWWYVDPDRGFPLATPGAQSFEAARAFPVRYIENALAALGESPTQRRDAVIVLRASGDDRSPTVHLPAPDAVNATTVHIGGFRGLARQNGVIRPSAVYIVGETPVGALVIGPPPSPGANGRCTPGKFSAVHLARGAFHVQLHNFALAARSTCNDSRALKISGPGIADLSENTADIVLAGLRFPANLPRELGAVAATAPLRTTMANGVEMYGSIFGSPHGRVTGVSLHTGNTNWTFRYNEIYDSGASRAGGDGTVLRSKNGTMGVEVSHNIIDSLGEAILIQAGGEGLSSTDASCRRQCQKIESWFFDVDGTRGGEAWRDFPLATPGYPTRSRFAEGARWADWTGSEDRSGQYRPARIAFNILRGSNAVASISVMGAYGLDIVDNYVESPIRFEQQYRALHRNHPVADRVDFSPAIPASQANRVNYWGGDRPAPGAPEGSGRYRRPDAALTKTNAVVHPAMRIVIWTGSGEVNLRGTCAAFQSDLVEKRQARTINGVTVVVGPEMMNPVPVLWESGEESGTRYDCNEAAFRERHAGKVFGAAGWDVSAIYRHLGMEMPSPASVSPLDYGTVVAE